MNKRDNQERQMTKGGDAVSGNHGEDIIFILTKDEFLACASELGIPKEQVTDDVIESVNRGVSLEFGNWLEVVKAALMEAIKCPLGLVCYQSCYWWKDGKCTFPRGDK